jgi:hypothetical protein
MTEVVADRIRASDKVAAMLDDRTAQNASVHPRRVSSRQYIGESAQDPAQQGHMGTMLPARRFRQEVLPTPRSSIQQALNADTPTYCNQTTPVGSIGAHKYRSRVSLNTVLTPSHGRNFRQFPSGCSRKLPPRNRAKTIRLDLRLVEYELDCFVSTCHSSNRSQEVYRTAMGYGRLMLISTSQRAASSAMNEREV